MSSPDEPLAVSLKPQRRGETVVLALAMALLSGLVFFTGAYQRDLSTSREGRVASCARAMIETGDWIEPNLGDEFRAKKPPMAYWLAALAALAFTGGEVTEFAAKLPSIIAGAGTVALVFWLGFRGFRSRRAGVLSALVLTTSVAFINEAATASTDMIMTFFIVLSVAAFWRVVEEGRDGKLDRALAWLSLGLAFLTKGPVAVAVPLLAVLGQLGFQRRWRDMRLVLPTLSGWILFLAVALPWYVAILLRHREALSIWVSESVGRLSPTTESHHNANPLYYLTGRIWGYLAPWVSLLPAVAVFWRGRSRRGPAPRGLWLVAGWGGLGFALFSISFSKRGYYLLPLVPAFALAFGGVLDEFIRRGVPRPSDLLVRVPLGALGVLLLLGLPARLLGPAVLGDSWPDELSVGALPLILFAVAGAIIIGLAVRSPSRRGLLVGAALASSLALVVWIGAAAVLESVGRGTVKDFCLQTQGRVPPGETISSVGVGPFPCLVYYLGRGRVESRSMRELLGEASARPSEDEGFAIMEFQYLPLWREAGLRVTVEVEEDRPGKRSRLVLFRWSAQEPGESPR